MKKKKMKETRHTHAADERGEVLRARVFDFVDVDGRQVRKDRLDGDRGRGPQLLPKIIVLDVKHLKGVFRARLCEYARAMGRVVSTRMPPLCGTESQAVSLATTSSSADCPAPIDGFFLKKSFTRMNKDNIVLKHE